MCHCHDFRQGLAALGTKPSLKRNVRGLPFSIVTYDAHLRPWVCNHFSILQAFAQTSHTHTHTHTKRFIDIPGLFRYWVLASLQVRKQLWGDQRPDENSMWHGQCQTQFPVLWQLFGRVENNRGFCVPIVQNGLHMCSGTWAQHKKWLQLHSLMALRWDWWPFRKPGAALTCTNPWWRSDFSIHTLSIHRCIFLVIFRACAFQLNTNVHCIAICCWKHTHLQIF